MAGAGAALLVAAVGGAYLVLQPTAETATTAVRRLAWLVAEDLGVSPRDAYDLVEFALNIALFVPGSLASALLWPRVRWWHWVLVGLTVSVAVETFQGAFLPGREAQARDLVSNTLGAALGAGLAVLVRRDTARRT